MLIPYDAEKIQRISIHALREEGDMPGNSICQTIEDFYPRPPRGGRPQLIGLKNYLEKISIHALREEGDGVL